MRKLRRNKLKLLREMRMIRLKRRRKRLREMMTSTEKATVRIWQATV